MSKYYKEEDLQKALINFTRGTGIDSKPYNPFNYAVNVLALLPVIEVSEDCIDRYSVLAELDPRSYEYKAVKELPPVIPKVKEGEWIPCSERLPREYSDDERVLATTDVDGLGVILIPAYDVKSWYRKGYITAWMPLPEPWKGADDES